MSYKFIIEVLHQLGFSKLSAEVYIYLAKEGAKTIEELATGLIVNKGELTSVLESLESEGTVIATQIHSKRFIAIKFDELLQNYVTNEAAIARNIVKNRETLIDNWVKFVKNKI